MKLNKADLKALSVETVAAKFRQRGPQFEKDLIEAEASAYVTQTMRLARIDAGLSQAELGELVDRHQPAIARLELGGYERCTVSTLRTILRALNRDFDFANWTKPCGASVVQLLKENFDTQPFTWETPLPTDLAAFGQLSLSEDKSAA